MDSFEFNKIFGAILGTLLFLMGLGIISNTIYTPHAPEKSAYALPEPSEEGGAAAPAAKKATPLPVLLAKADAAKGASLVKAACSSCHTFDKGGAVKQGPNLYGIVGRQMASVAGFSYSNGMKAAAEKNKTWSFEHLASFIHNPRGFASGTKMAYAGQKNEGRLADILVYLHTLADSPVALPKVEAAPASPEAKPDAKPAANPAAKPAEKK
ncbi:MAG: cytochrome c family protein [Hyphomicrobiales bacterium]|nr:cytochrome c family protein [Hyphomicrobiales bacterium]